MSRDWNPNCNCGLCTRKRGKLPTTKRTQANPLQYGYIVVQHTPTQFHSNPRKFFQHESHAAAKKEARRLTEIHGGEFVVYQPTVSIKRNTEPTTETQLTGRLP